jgi:hypothetical protein
MPLTNGSGSVSGSGCDPDPDPETDPSISITDLQDAHKKFFFFKKVSCILLFEGTFTSFLKIKSQKEVTKQ